MFTALCDSTELATQQEKLKEELKVVVGLTERKRCVAENAQVIFDQEDYARRYNTQVERYEKAKVDYDEVTVAIADRAARK